MFAATSGDCLESVAMDFVMLDGPFCIVPLYDVLVPGARCRSSFSYKTFAVIFTAVPEIATIPNYEIWLQC